MTEPVKIRVTLKDPDTMHDAVDEAAKRWPQPDGISAAEWALIRDARADEIKGAITHDWMKYGEYLEVDFTVNADGKTSAIVVPLRKEPSR